MTVAVDPMVFLNEVAAPTVTFDIPTSSLEGHSGEGEYSASFHMVHGAGAGERSAGTANSVTVTTPDCVVDIATQLTLVHDYDNAQLEYTREIWATASEWCHPDDVVITGQENWNGHVTEWSIVDGHYMWQGEELIDLLTDRYYSREVLSERDLDVTQSAQINVNSRYNYQEPVEEASCSSHIEHLESCRPAVTTVYSNDDMAQTGGREGYYLDGSFNYALDLIGGQNCQNLQASWKIVDILSDVTLASGDIPVSADMEWGVESTIDYTVDESCPNAYVAVVTFEDAVAAEWELPSTLASFEWSHTCECEIWIDHFSLVNVVANEAEDHMIHSFDFAVFADNHCTSESLSLEIATENGFSETVQIEDISSGSFEYHQDQHFDQNEYTYTLHYAGTPGASAEATAFSTAGDNYCPTRDIQAFIDAANGEDIHHAVLTYSEVHDVSVVCGGYYITKDD